MPEEREGSAAPANVEILAWEETPLGPLCLRRRRLLAEPDTVVTEITLDHALLMSSLHTDSERALAARALERHPGRDLAVLIGGLGLGYTAEAVLASDRVGRVRVAELLPPVLAWMREGRVPLAAALNADRRLEVFEADVYALLAGPPPDAYDLILIDVDHAPSERLAHGDAGFYTGTGLERARAHLAPGGVLGVWSSAESPSFAAAMSGAFDDVAVRPVTFRNRHLGRSQTDWLFFGTRPATAG